MHWNDAYMLNLDVSADLFIYFVIIIELRTSLNYLSTGTSCSGYLHGSRAYKTETVCGGSDSEYFTGDISKDIHLPGPTIAMTSL